MKKQMIFVAMVCFSISLMGDNPQIKTSKTDIENTGGSRFAACMEDAVFSQVFDFNGTTQISNVGLREVANQYTASGPFQSVRFWWWDPQTNLSEDNIFTIKVYDGPPNDPGTQLVHTTLQDGAIILDEEQSWGSIFRIDLELTAPVTLSNGWIGISAYNPDTEIYHISFFHHNESGLTPLMYFDETWHSEANSNNLFCLGAEEVPIPISNFALFISIIMIGLFIIIPLFTKISG